MVNNVRYAVATLAATIVGVGMFGLPFVASRAGFFILLGYLAIFTLVFIMLHLMFGEIMLRTHARHRLVGYAGVYLSDTAKKILALAGLVGLSGGMLVYILVGATFMKELTGGVLGSDVMYQVVFWALMSMLVLSGLKAIKRSEFVMLVLMVVIIVLLFLASIPHLEQKFLLNGVSLSEFFLPYGVVLFALSGFAAIPTVREVLTGQERHMKRAIVLGTLLPALLYVLFTGTVLGVTGEMTSENALSGLAGELGRPVVLLGAVLGILLVATSYVVFGLYLRDMLRYDIGISWLVSVSAALFIPFALIFVSWGSFIEIIGFLGVLLGGIEGIFLILIWRRARIHGDRQPEFALSIPSVAVWALVALFATGMFYTILFDGHI